MIQVYPKYSYHLAKFDDDEMHQVCIEYGDGECEYETKDSAECCYEFIRELRANQINHLTQKYFDIHLINCGQCGAILSHHADSDGEDIVCHHCNTQSRSCDCPDLFC